MYGQTINNDVTLTGGENPLLAGRYQVVRQLGTGGMGSVWLAEDTQLDNKPFAIKMLPSILVSNKRAYRQLKDEALVAMKLTHPNIVTLRAFEENNGNPFLVMDYIEGQTLDDYLAEKGKLSENEVIRVLRPIAAALDYAHGEGVVHRDVKPANVMIRKDGHPFILDFGIAREIQETMTRVTGKLSSGTLLYMSPEQLHGAVPKKEQDIYSFAAMAYECLKGEPPFCRGQIEHQIDNDMPEPLSGGVRFVASVMAGLAKKPEDRPPTCMAVLEGEDLTQRRGGAEAQSGRVRTPAVSRMSLEGNERKTGGGKTLAILVFLAILAGGGVWWMRAGNGTNVTNGTRGTPPPQVQGPDKPLLGPTETDVRDLAATSAVLRTAVEQQIPDKKGFDERKVAITKILWAAESWQEKKIWVKAASEFTNYVENGNALLKLYREYQGAIAKRAGANKARQDAQEAGAEQYAEELWKTSTNEFSSANADFENVDRGDKRFEDAGVAFEKIKWQFEQCAKEAKYEREKQKKEASKVKDSIGALLSDDGDITRCNVKQYASEYFKKGKDRWEDGKKAFNEEDFTKAKQLFDESKSHFEKAIDEATAKVKGKQEEAEAVRKKAYEAKQTAEEAEAKEYAEKLWNDAEKLLNDAEKLLNDAVKQFSLEEFANASNKFASATEQFKQCTEEAKNERERLAKSRQSGQYREATQGGLQDTNETIKHEGRVPSNIEPVILRESPVKEKTILLPNDVPIRMVWCGPGVVRIGFSGEERSVKGFWIGKYEVTQKQWASVMHDNPSQRVDPRLPVEGLTWNKCKLFVTELKRRTRYNFRLPEGYEWEYAAKGGHKGFVEQNRDEIAWWRGNSGDGTHLGGQKKANRLGLYDMLGNVWEWCENTGPDGVKHEIRGGDYHNDGSCSYSSPEFVSPDEVVTGAGLRLVCDKL